MATKMQIVVVDSGWVFIGETQWVDDGQTLAIKSPLNIRVWGTDKGLGQLAIEGPQSATALDAFTDLYLPKGKVIYTMDVVHEGPWVAKDAD